MPDFMINEQWMELPIPSVGDIVHLYFGNAYLEYAKVIVRDPMSSEIFSGITVGVFDGLKNVQVYASAYGIAMGKEVFFRRENIFNVIKPI